MICENLLLCNHEQDYICDRKSDCLVYCDKRSKAVCEEKGKRYELVNDKGGLVALRHVDGGMIRGEDGIRKCDYLYTVLEEERSTAVFVELKGKDIPHAVNQIRASVDRYGKQLGGRIFARIICKSVPRLYNDPAIRNLKRELRNQYQGDMAISENSRSDIYSQLGRYMNGI